MVTYIRSDLDFILAQIKIAEAHAAGQPLYGPGLDGIQGDNPATAVNESLDDGLIPTYNLAWGLRTVDGSNNHLLPGQEQWGAAGGQFPHLVNPNYRPADGTVFDPDGGGPAPAMPTAPNYNPSNNPNALVFDSSLRTISNLLVDQTLGNPAAVLTALDRAGSANSLADLPAVTAIYAAFKPSFDAEYQARVVMQNAKTAVDAAILGADHDPLTPLSPAEQTILDNANAAFSAAVITHTVSVDALEAARVVRDAALEPFGITMDGDNVHLPAVAPDEGLSAPFNSWFTLFGQFFDHGLDLVNKGGSGTVFIPLQPDDPLYVEGSHTNFMVLTRATNTAGPDGIFVDNPSTAANEAADNVGPINTTTSFVDQNQTYTSHSSHQVFLRQYVLNGAGDPVATGKLIEGANGGMATWGEVKAQAASMLGIKLTDFDVGSVPLLRTDAYGNFIAGPNGMPQIIIGVGGDGIPNTGDDAVVEGNLANPVDPSNVFNAVDPLLKVGAIRTPHAFLADIAHDAVPIGKIADGDITIGLGNPGNGSTEYDNELLDAHFIAGDGRVNENIGLTAVHHVFHAEHNRLLDHTKDVVLASGDVAFINQWLVAPITAADVDTQAERDALKANLAAWDGERLFQAAKFGTEMQYQHLVFEEFARKIQPNINVFLVPDGFDTTLDPSIVAEFAHVVYRFGHSMLTEQIDRFDPDFDPDTISLIEGFLNPTAFNGENGVIEDEIAAGAIIRGMTRQVGNEIDEFVTSALRNNLLGLPLDLATINLARGRDTGAPTLNEARATFYEATNHDPLLKPYESWIDFAGHLKHEASIINFIAAYGTHASLAAADTLEEKRDAAMALVGLTATGNETVALTNASFELNSLADGTPGVSMDLLGNYTFTPPTGWTMSGTGGMFNPADGVTNNAAITGTNVVWLGQGGMLSQNTGVLLEEGATYSVNFDIGDRTDTAWPGGVARLVSNTTNTVLQELVLTEPADGQWANVSFNTGAIGAAVAGESLRIEIQQTGGSGNQILVDDVQLNIQRPLAPLNEEDRQAFLNGTGIYAGNLGGLNLVDLWIGGLAEEIMPFGGMLGSTFNFVFEVQMEKLQSGDRFYYLQRLDGLHLFGEMENNSFAAMIMRNTDATHLPSDVFSTPGLILELDPSRQFNDLDGDGTMEQTDPAGGGILTPDVVRNNPSTVGTDTNYLRYQGDEHVLLGGTDVGNSFNPSGNDILIAGIGDDTLFGDSGNDKLEGGFGNDIINAGDGDDIVTDMGGDDNIKAGKGHDVVHAGPGLDLVMGNDGQDFIFLGTDMGSEVFAGTGNDFIYGNKNAERILGNEGDDWIETGTFDGAPGDNFDEIFSHDGIDGNDVFLGDGGFDEFIGEGGDDIMVGSAGRGKMVGMSGFDWATYKDNTFGVNADLSIPIIFDEAPTLPQNAALDEYESMEGLSGTKFNDVLKGSNALAEERLPAAQGGSEGYLGSFLDAQGIALINGLQAVLGPDVTFFNAGDVILGGDGSDLIQGNAGDDIIDGDKWLNVRIGIMSSFTADGPTGTEVAGNPNIKSMTSMVTLRLDANGNMVTAPTGGTPTTKTLAAWMFEGKINPGQLQIIREITTAGADAIADIDTAKFQGNRGEYAFSATADGQVIVTHAIEDSLDGTDRLRNIERVEFLDNSPLNIIVGTPNNDIPLNGTAQDDLILGLAGADTLNGLAGNDILVGGADGILTTTTSRNYVDNFDSSNFGNSNGTTNWGPDWDESNDGGDSATAGQITLDNGQDALRFNAGDGAQIQRTVDLSGATTATLAYTVARNGLDGAPDSDSVTVFFSRNGTDFVQVDQITSTSTITPRNIDLTTFGTGPFTANAAVRFVANTLEAGEFVSIDTLVINSTTVTNTAAGDTLNGGIGDDTYSFAVGDGNDTINELANEGSADKISILAPSTGIDPETGLPILTINALNAFDSNTGNQNGHLVINYTLPTGTAQSITVNNHYVGANAQQGVELINFNGAVFNGYQLVGDYAVSRLDNGRNHAAATANMFIAGEDGDDDTITGGSGNDLIFGAGDGDDLVGGLGDDLLVGGAGDDDLDSRLNAAGDDFVGPLGADTMIGGAGNDTYGVDDLLDVVVEDAGAGTGTDTVQTFMAELSIAAMANVENLTYLGLDADQFIGTGNAGNNVISGGDLADTLSGLAGDDTLNGGLGADILSGGDNNDTLNGGDDNDTLNGGLGNDTLDGDAGADAMTGGDGNDVYFVDDAGDTVSETNADALIGGTDRVESDISYTLGANVENLDLNGAAIIGRGNTLANVINGNDEANQLFGGGGNDTLNGDDGADVIDGGDGDDTFNGANNDENDTYIGGAGNDTFNLNAGGANDTLLYNASGFGNDVVNNFDANAAGGQDLIDLRAFGLTAANIGATATSRIQVENIVEAGTDDTRITIRDAGGATMGTIYLEDVENAITATDFILAAAPPAVFGAPTAAANVITGTAAANTINGLGGNDTLSGAGGDDVINGDEGTDTLNGGDGNDTLSGGAGAASGTFADNFGGESYANNNGTLSFTGNWTETNDAGGATGGDIEVNPLTTGRLHFEPGIDGGESVQRSFNLTGATSASVQFTFVGDTTLLGGDSVSVQAWNHTTSTWETLTGGTLSTTSGTFNQPLSAAQIGPNSAIRFLANGAWDADDEFFIDSFIVNASGLNAGVDTINGDAGDDTIIWNANAVAPTDGRDTVNGGTEGAAGDTFVVNGNASAETYRIYAMTGGQNAGLAATLGTTFAAATEIVVTRTVGATTTIVAELSEIEEIRINGADPSGTSGPAGADNYEIIGDFAGTSLRLNTITIDGDAGNDTIDITSLDSAHRIVFRSNGGHDTIIGTLRPEDVIELPGGASASEYESTTNAEGVTTLTKGDNSISYKATGAGPQVGPEEGDEEEELPDDEVPAEEPDDEDDPEVVVVPGLGTANNDVLVGSGADDHLIGFEGDDVIIGHGGADVLLAGAGSDFVAGWAGQDTIFADAGDDTVLGGDDADLLYGGDGDDRIFGDAGNDMINAGNGNDIAVGGSGNDRFIAQANDGNDSYFGDDMAGGAGIDTLNMSAITANITVDLGTSVGGLGSASSTLSGSDTLWGIENVVTGSGADRITASDAVNLMDGGTGNDTFVFRSVAAANGDTIVGFETGDKIDLSNIDANTTTAGNQAFGSTIVSSGVAAVGQLLVTHETVDGVDYTVVQGNVDNDNPTEFRVNIVGTHNLTASDFTL